MKNILIYTFIIVCNLTTLAYGQKPTKIRLFYQSSDLKKPDNDTLNIERIRHSNNSDSLFVRLKNKEKILLPPDKIWGFQDEDNTIFRNFEGFFYRVLQVDTLVIYSRKSGKINYYYFSKGCEGKINNLNTENLKKEFPNNECFINKIENELKWYQEYSSYNDKTKCYRIIEFFKSCTENNQSTKIN